MLLAALQMCSSMDFDENFSVIEQGCIDANAQGVSYLQLPEMAIMFAENHDGLRAWVRGGGPEKAIAALGDLARTHQLFLHVGSMAVASKTGKCLNRSFLFAPSGEIVAQYDKIHLFDADVAGDAPYRESKNFDAGDQAVLAQMAGVGLGMSICYDVRFPSLYGTLREAGAEVIAVPAAFTVPTGKAHWETLLRARAIETGCFLVAAAQGGMHANGRRTYGHSMILNPWGEAIARCVNDQTGLIVASFAADAIKDARSRLPTLANSRHFSLNVNHNGAQ